MVIEVVVLTGAGISAESGLATFRGDDGLWENHRVEDVATPEAFVRDPELVQRFYNQRRQQLLNPEIAPNPAHVALAELQRAKPGKVFIVTQNIDDLHERAGAEVRHMHGELLNIRCMACVQIQRTSHDVDETTQCSYCGVQGQMRPDIVWFGEMPYFMGEIEHALAQAEQFVAIGTSGLVYPAAGFVAQAKDYGARCVEINLEPTAVSSIFDQGYYGAASEEVPRWVETLL
ncbi:NAD-dependent protein deacylase [Suttonella sp. R2A3]|uniref:Sir2 family NAD+-dependent deacetylase n=1 Tax=Suttonella sp. R2A3 TaxID=2908648 RepID=UPI001F3E519D|nr:Sir2 family NAD+-dependent deacetylase [Suttonella sp. R2A3]UJF25175.1 NAD-dependent protein deacylase [Suttonella sp. R2A3]